MSIKEIVDRVRNRRSNQADSGELQKASQLIDEARVAIVRDYDIPLDMDVVIDFDSGLNKITGVFLIEMKESDNWGTFKTIRHNVTDEIDFNKYNLVEYK